MSVRRMQTLNSLMRQPTTNSSHSNTDKILGISMFDFIGKFKESMFLCRLVHLLGLIFFYSKQKEKSRNRIKELEAKIQDLKKKQVGVVFFKCIFFGDQLKSPSSRSTLNATEINKLHNFIRQINGIQQINNSILCARLFIF